MMGGGSHHVAPGPAYNLPLLHLMLAVFSPLIPAFGARMFTAGAELKFHMQVACCHFFCSAVWICDGYFDGRR